MTNSNEPAAAAGEQSGPSRSNWAWLLFDGPVALFLVFCGVYFVIGQRDQWAERSSKFHEACVAQRQFDADTATLVDINVRLRAGLARLNGYPHPYPTPDISSEPVAYGCSADETTTPPAMPDAAADQLIAALFAPPGAHTR